MILWTIALLTVSFVLAAIGIKPKSQPRQRVTPNVIALKSLSDRARGKVA